jgi:Metallo-beta-lactamase superfamily
VVSELVDPADLRWIILTHDDRDHAGNLKEVLMAAPDATLITNGLALARLGEEWDVPRHRVRLVNPGRRLELGGRELTLLRPPSYGSPSSLAVSTLARSLSWSSRWPRGWCGARPGGGKSGSQCSAGVDLGPYLDRLDGRPAARATRHDGPQDTPRVGRDRRYPAGNTAAPFILWLP